MTDNHGYKMVSTGLEQWILRGEGKNRRIALIANQTSVTGSLDYSWDALVREGYRIERIFSPEHGLFATEQDQVAVGAQPDPGIDTVSLYGDSENSLAPDDSLLEGIDLVLFDIQDVGARYYTYVNTLVLFMKRLAGRGIPITVLDRPNPIGGVAVEGPMLSPGFESFVGVMPVAARHGLTAGEIALMAKDFFRMDIDVTVCAMKGWSRSMNYTETGLPWIPPSPNMPDQDTALLYPGFCLFEALNVSEGRGTTVPFKCVGAPFVEPGVLAREANALGLAGVRFRPAYFRPTFNKYAGMTVGGVYTHVTDPASFRPFYSAMALIVLLRKHHGDRLVFLHDVYEYNSLHPAFDLLAGNASIRRAVLEELSPEQCAELWRADESDFLDRREKYLLY